MATMSSNRETFTSKPVDSSQAPVGYESQWMNNPYATFDYHHTWWQKLLEGFGIRTDFNKYQESMNMNAKEYEAQLLEKAHNEEFDSAAEQASRMRQAGINPDLQGGVDAGGSSGMEPDPSMPAAPGDDRAAFAGFANTVMGIFTTAIGFGKDALSLMQMRNAVESGNIANTAALFDMGYRAAVSFIPEKYPGSDDPDWMNRATDLAYSNMAPFLSKKQQRSFRNQLNALYGSAPVQAEQWESWLKNAKGKMSIAQTYGSEFFGDGSDEVIFEAAKILSRYSDKYVKESARGQAEGAENEASYQAALDPALQAQVENETNRRNVASAGIDATLNEALGAIIEMLRDKSESGKKGHGFASVALILFSLFRMMNFSHSRGSVGGVDTSKTTIGF